jgi:hypothetical protein
MFDDGRIWIWIRIQIRSRIINERSGSGRPKNLGILRIRIHNTARKEVRFLSREHPFQVASQQSYLIDFPFFSLNFIEIFFTAFEFRFGSNKKTRKKGSGNRHTDMHLLIPQGADPLPPSSTCSKAGRNTLNEEITPPPSPLG